MSKMIVEGMYKITGRGIVLTGTADCQPKIGPMSITNPDGKYWETDLIGIESLGRQYDKNKARPVGLLVRGIKENDVKNGAIIRFTPFT